jgi:uncharacterized protein with NAD-binding domain and iron-sulfur cluster
VGGAGGGAPVSAPEAAQTERPIKVAVLGGGCGGLAAAWALTSTPALRRRFEVTVYQLGWQLGGKGASGRAPHSPDGLGAARRIEEHGLHIWFGFYDHAFRMLRGAYEEAGLAAGEDWWTVPFEKCDAVSLYEQVGDGAWVRQSIRLPRRGGADRGPPTQSRRPPLSRVIARTTRLLANGLRAELGGGDSRRGGGGAAPVDDGLVGAASTLDQIAAEIDALDSPLTLDADGEQPRTRGAGQLGVRSVNRVREAAVDPLLGRLADQVRALQHEFDDRTPSDRVRLWRGVVELVAASLTGILRDEILWRGFGSIDQEDLRGWLGRHGASEETLARSPVLRGLYDLTFAYRGGDKQEPSLAAGRGLQSLLMMINYEGAFMWRMRAGMGDVVFSPLYLALRDRGVRFEFFSRVSQVRLMPGRPAVDAIDLTREATIIAGPDRYEPIERIGDWWCWPAAPDSGQLTDAPVRSETLRHGEDFDEVVLAIPVGALPDICSELIRADPRFRQMVERAGTVQTKAFQVWLTRPIEELRGQPGRDRLDPPATAYEEPFDTYCDMSHLLPAENYGDGDGPRGVAYFCAVLPDGADTEDVRANALRYLEHEAAAIWPGAFTNGEFDWSVVFDPENRTGRDRLDAQYVRANVAPTDRYVTTPAGSVDARLDPGASGFENLVLAGDWTHNGIDGGCVEAAVISGERAADAIVARAGALRRSPSQPRYVEYGALATAPGPLLCERAQLYCFFVQSERTRVQQLCDRVLSEPSGGALRYVVPRVAPVILSLGTIAGLRSLHPAHSNRGTASEPEAAIWIPLIAQRFEADAYIDDHLAIFMPYIWVDDPIAFASGREVYGYPKTQGWMRRLADPRATGGERPPDPPEELALDVYGVERYGEGSELTRRRLLTIRSRGARRGGERSETRAEGDDLGSLVTHLLSDLDPDADIGLVPHRSAGWSHRAAGRIGRRTRILTEAIRDQVVWQVFLKQVRDAGDGERAVLQQIVEARSSVAQGSLRWRRLRGSYELSVESLASHPLEDELGLVGEQTVKRAFVAEFGFRMEPGTVRWP